MFSLIRMFIMTLMIFLVIDLVWIIFVVRGMYESHISSLMGPLSIWPSILFYIIYVSGLIFFVINPAIEKNSIIYAIFAGAFFGLVCYGTYDLTNLATLKDWPLIITISDLGWGVFITAFTSGIVFQVTKLFGWYIL